MEHGYFTDSASDAFRISPPFRRHEIASLIHQIKEVFDLHFDRSWLAIVIDELPMDRRTVREIREFLALSDLVIHEDQRIEAGIDELRRYIWTLRTHLLPQAKELLGVSPFTGNRGAMDKSQFVLRRLTAHALPYNLDRLESLVDSLEILFRERQIAGNTARIASIEESSIDSSIESA